ncbi:MAG TPA: NADH-quinone oxidoreductase subunit M [Actinomycetes bacterium]|nr:NADH-quinone oxidoreductase subunit M [Actinomycetes bacterium]
MALSQALLLVAVFAPLAGGLAVLVVPRSRPGAVIATAALAALLALAAGIALLARFDYAAGRSMQFEVRTGWISAVGVGFHLGIDGISLPLLILSLLLTFVCVLYSARILPAPGNPKAFLALVLLLETGVNGTFSALDLVLFFVFFELVLVPMYFLVAIWGGERREYAAVKFFLYTFIGSVFMLLGFIALWYRSAPVVADRTFDVLALQQLGEAGRFAGTFGLLAFAAMGFGFAVKTPMWPLHTWLPDAHTEAPTVGSVLLAGVLLKLGTYGFVRLAVPILPEAAHDYAPLIGVLAAIAIVYGSLCCLAQTDLKRLIAYSSVGHMGFVMLGIATLTPAGINAAVFGMVGHGLVTGMLFFCAGSVHERYHTREIAEIGGGMSAKLPHLGGVLAFTSIASLGLPGLAGFWGEVLALLAAWQPAAGLSTGLFRTLMVVGGIGTLLTAGYFLWMLQRVNYGLVPERWRSSPFKDLLTIETISWAPLLVLIVAVGLVPGLVLWISDPAVQGWFGGLFT